MAYKGQPVPTTLHQHGYFKVSDGKSVRVTVPANSGPIPAGSLQEFGGFLGFATSSEQPLQWVTPGNVLDDSDQPQELILTIAQEEYQTNQIAEEGDFEVGTEIYWDPVNKVLTEDEDDGDTPPVPYRKAGRVTVARDSNDVIQFILGPQV